MRQICLSQQTYSTVPSSPQPQLAVFTHVAIVPLTPSVAFRPLTPSVAFRSHSEPVPLGLRPDAADLLVTADVQHGAVVAPAAVGGLHPRRDRPQVLALGGEDEHPAGAGGE